LLCRDGRRVQVVEEVGAHTGVIQISHFCLMGGLLLSEEGRV